MKPLLMNPILDTSHQMVSVQEKEIISFLKNRSRIGDCDEIAGQSKTVK